MIRDGLRDSIPTKELFEAVERMDDLEREKSTLEAKNRELEDQKQKLEDDFDDLYAEVVTLRIENRVLNMKCQSMEAKIEKRAKTNIASLYGSCCYTDTDSTKMNDKILKLETHIKGEIVNLDAIEKALTQLLCRLDDKLTRDEEMHIRILISSLGEMIERSNRV